MALFNGLTRPKRNENKQLFRPYHYLGLFDRTSAAADRGEGVVCTMICVASVEAYINDVEGWYSYAGSNAICFHENDRLVNNYLTETEKELVKKLKENERLSIEDKLSLFGSWDKSEKVYQDFKNLITIRNGLTHLKPEELCIDKETGDYTGYPKFLSNLIQSKIVVKPKEAISWIESLEGQEYCFWCQHVTYQVLQRLNKMLPESPVSKHFSQEVF